MADKRIVKKLEEAKVKAHEVFQHPEVKKILEESDKEIKTKMPEIFPHVKDFPLPNISLEEFLLKFSYKELRYPFDVVEGMLRKDTFFNEMFELRDEKYKKPYYNFAKMYTDLGPQKRWQMLYVFGTGQVASFNAEFYLSQLRNRGIVKSGHLERNSFDILRNEEVKVLLPSYYLDAPVSIFREILEGHYVLSLKDKEQIVYCMSADKINYERLKKQS